MKVGEICDQNVAIIGKHGSVDNAARLMRDQHVCDVVVVESHGGINLPVGMLTERDIVIAIIAEGLAQETTQVADLMHNHLLIVNEYDDVMSTLKRMRYKGIRRIPVTSQTKGLLGILSIDNILETLIEQLVDVDQIISRNHCSDEQLSLRLSN